MKAKQKSGDKIIVALDNPDIKWVKQIVKRLHRVVSHFKVGSELYTAHGREAVKAVRWAGGHVFLDLKFHDIPNTVAGAVREAARQNVFMLTIHACGGSQMMEAARQAAEEMSRKRKVKRRPMIVGVTVLTSMSENEMHEELGISRSLENQVLHLAKLADRAGLDGIVASGRELPTIRAHMGHDFLVVTPGIRPEWSVKGDQSRVMTPKKALSLGADYLVVGRPITAAPDPLEAAHKLLAEL